MVNVAKIAAGIRRAQEYKKQYDEYKKEYNKYSSLVGEWNSRQKESTSSDENKDESGFDNTSFDNMSFRQHRVNAKARLNELKRFKKSKNGDVPRSALVTAQIATYGLYRAAWLNLEDTFGIAYIYIIIHWWAKYVFHKPGFSHFAGIISNPQMKIAKIVIGLDGPSYPALIVFHVINFILILIMTILMIIQLIPIIIVLGLADQIVGFVLKIVNNVITLVN